MSTLTWLLSIISAMFMMLNHPLSLVLLLITLTLTLIMIFMTLSNLSWLSMILFLIFLGGLLVIFTYLSALVPNEVYFFNMLWLLLMMNPLFILITLEGQLPLAQNTNILQMVSMTETSSVFFFLGYLMMALVVTMTMSQKMKTPLSQSSY